MSEKKDSTNSDGAGSDAANYFPGNASRVRNKTVTLSAGTTRKLREMVEIPEKVQLASGDWLTPQITSGLALPAAGPEVAPLKTEEVPLTPVVGFLVSFDKSDAGEIVPLRIGRWILGSHQARDTSRNIAIADESISHAHAILRVNAAEEIDYIDQLSENGSSLVRNGNEEPINERSSRLQHGDILKVGKRNFHVCLVKTV